MNNKMRWFTKGKLILATLLLITIAGYFYYQEKLAMFARPLVTVVPTIRETVPVTMNFVGNTAAIQTVDIRARVEGFLIERAFVEGDDVTAGALMYVIDPKPFEAALDKAKAQLANNEATLAYAVEQVGRYRGLVEKDYVTREDFDNLVTQMEQAKAAVDAARAEVKTAELNLGYCRMYATFDGRVGKTFVHVGNLVGAGGQDTKLATMVKLDPIYAYFSPSDEQTYKILSSKKLSDISVRAKLTDGSEYRYKGKIDFVNNEVDQATSTVAMRAVIPNPDKILLPGVYVNLTLELGEAANTLVVPEKAISEDQAGEYVIIIGKNEKAQKKYVKTAHRYNGNITVTSGLNGGEFVVTEGMQTIRPGMNVRIKMAQKSKGRTFRDVLVRAVFGD